MSTSSQQRSDFREAAGGVEDNETLIVERSVGSRFFGVNDITDVGLGGGLTIFLDERFEGVSIGLGWVVDCKTPTG